jgi:hypothetical protein
MSGAERSHTRQSQFARIMSFAKGSTHRLQPAPRAGICHHLHGSANSAPPIARVAIADSASDQCTPIRRPARPTEMPLKARRPRLAMLNRPMTRPRLSGGELDQGLRHGVEGQFQESRGKQEAERERIVGCQREDRKRSTPQHGEHDRGARPRRQQSPAFEHHARQQPAAGIGGQFYCYRSPAHHVHSS